MLFAALLRARGGGGLVRLGSGYGGWWVPESALIAGAVAYCAGAGEDITFDLALHERGLKVTTFDPTPRAIAYVESVGISGDRFRFVAVGWWDEETEVRFYAPRDPAHVSHSAVNLQHTDTYFTAPVKTVAALARELGDSEVDVVKMDIEGAEVRVIRSLLQHGPLPSVLCVEFDQPQPFLGVLRGARALRERGYRVASLEGWNATFVRHATDQ
jgi:FkbM family methyltransferase